MASAASLYDDLDESSTMDKLAEAREKLNAQNAANMALRSQLAAAAQREFKLENENEILDKNISALYNEAKLEVKKRDEELGTVRREIAESEQRIRQPQPQPQVAARVG